MFWCESPRDVVQVAGSDAATYLHSQVSNDIAAMAIGDSRWAFLLQPTGKVDALARVWRTEAETFVLDTDAGFGATMVARLNRFKIRVKVEITELPWRCIAVRGGDADGLVAWGNGADLLGPDVVAPNTVAGIAADLLDDRIAAGWPAMGAEIIPGETVPAELGISEAAVSFTKGCYPGQELIERMDSRGARAPRHLVVLATQEGDEPGSAVMVAGEEVGRVTSVGRTQVIALVRRGVDAVRD